MDIEITRDNRIICEECWNADVSVADFGNAFLASTKLDDRLSKDNLKLYKVKWVKGDGQFNKINLKPGDVVMTEAVGVDIELEGKQYKIFDTNFIVAKVDIGQPYEILGWKGIPSDGKTICLEVERRETSND